MKSITKLLGTTGLAFFLSLSLGCYGVKKVVISPPPGLTEAPSGFDNETNGFVDQARHDADRDQFEEDAGDEIGPVFNHRSCLDCHSSPVTGGYSQVFEHRIAAGARLIHDQVVPGTAQEVSPAGAHNALRASISLMGDGFVEQVPDSLLKYIASVNGGVFVLVDNGRVGRFGHKDQHAGLFEFAGDADFNEKGVGNRVNPDPDNGIEDLEPTCLGGGEDIDCYTRFMQALKAPPRGKITDQVNQGEEVFYKIGCAFCHTPTLYTSKNVFHPYGDYLLHNIGTGDGVAQGAAPANVVRTAPLWGLRTKSRMLHDGRVFDVLAAIKAHEKEADRSEDKFERLSKKDKENLLVFLNSL